MNDEAIDGNGFISQYLIIENNSSPKSMQVLSIRVSANYTTFYNSSFKGYHENLYSRTLHQFYRECTIFGIVDFIFGESSSMYSHRNPYQRNIQSTQVY